MDWLIVALVVVVVLVVGALALRQARSRSLQRRFGPEYDRLVEEEGGRRQAEAELSELAERRAALEISDLDPDARQAYTDEWRAVQERFIDEPRETVAEADALVQRVMRDRGYPVDEFDERIEMITVDHPGLAENYRVAHAVELRSEQDGATTDDLRDAFQRYRALFAELLVESTPAADRDGDHEDHEELPGRGGQ
jgi:hypothetical protein